MVSTDYSLAHSWLLAAGWVILLIATAGVLTTLSWPVYALLVLFALLVAYGVAVLRQCIWRNHHAAIIKLKIVANDEWQLYSRDEHCYTARLCRDSFVSSGLCVLRFRELNQRRTIIVLVGCDALPDQQYRHLLIRVRATRRFAMHSS